MLLCKNTCICNVALEGCVCASTSLNRESVSFGESWARNITARFSSCHTSLLTLACVCIYITCILSWPSEEGWLLRCRCQGRPHLVPTHHAVLVLKERVMSKAKMFFLFIHKPPYSECIARAEDNRFVTGSATAVVSITSYSSSSLSPSLHPVPSLSPGTGQVTQGP